MITVFNHRELIITHDMKVQADVRSLLAGRGIPYTVRTKNLLPAKTGSVGMDRRFNYEYKIYVHKNDLEEAAHLLRQINKE